MVLQLIELVRELFQFFLKKGDLYDLNFQHFKILQMKDCKLKLELSNLIIEEIKKRTTNPTSGN